MAPVARIRWLPAAVVGLPLGLIVSLGMLYFGFVPTHIVSCSQQSGFESAFFGDRLGHVDGPGSTDCIQPTRGAYVLAGVFGLGTFGLTVRAFRW